MYGENEYYITSRTDSLRGLLTLVFGHTAMLDLVVEQRLDFSIPEKISRTSRVMEAHIHPNTWNVFSVETLQSAKLAFQDCSAEFKNRVELAFSFIARSVNVADHAVRYSNTWIALEIAAGGHRAVRTFLNGLDPKCSQEAKRFFDLRNALFHHGQRPIFEQADERFLCACVLALILQDIGINDPAFADLVQEQIRRNSMKNYRYFMLNEHPP